jgi:hypothetical protein
VERTAAGELSAAVGEPWVIHQEHPRPRMSRLYSERPVLNKLGDEVEPGRPGWLTTTVTKPLMIDDPEQALRTFGVRLSDAGAISELAHYQTGKDGRTGAPSGENRKNC